MRELYQHKKSGNKVFVLFDIIKKDCEVERYTVLDNQYKFMETTTQDNLDKNYTLIEPQGKDKQMLEYIRMSK